MSDATPGTIPEIIERLGGAAALARAIGVGPSTASEMKRRASIPVAHWAGVLEFAKEKGVPLSYEALAKANLKREHAS